MDRIFPSAAIKQIARLQQHRSFEIGSKVTTRDAPVKRTASLSLTYLCQPDARPAPRKLPWPNTCNSRGDHLASGINSAVARGRRPTFYFLKCIIVINLAATYADPSAVRCA